MRTPPRCCRRTPPSQHDGRARAGRTPDRDRPRLDAQGVAERAVGVRKAKNRSRCSLSGRASATVPSARSTSSSSTVSCTSRAGTTTTRFRRPPPRPERDRLELRHDARHHAMRERCVREGGIGRHRLGVHPAGGRVDLQDVVQAAHIEPPSRRDVAVAEQVGSALVEPQRTAVPRPAQAAREVVATLGVAGHRALTHSRPGGRGNHRDLVLKEADRRRRRHEAAMHLRGHAAVGHHPAVVELDLEHLRAQVVADAPDLRRADALAFHGPVAFRYCAASTASTRRESVSVPCHSSIPSAYAAFTRAGTGSVRRT